MTAGDGVDVVLRLLERLDAPMIDVACGRKTPMAGDRTFPNAGRTNADGGSGLDLPSTSRQPFGENRGRAHREGGGGRGLPARPDPRPDDQPG